LADFENSARRPVRGSTTGRPIMALLDLLGRRWTLRIVWELRDGALTARALRGACDDASPTVLQARLRDLAGAELVENQRPGGYRLTEQGRALMTAFEPLYHFAEGWGVAQNPPSPLAGEGVGGADG
jgi:DNA-binding HxlR family transcriptional regulator